MGKADIREQSRERDEPVLRSRGGKNLDYPKDRKKDSGKAAVPHEVSQVNIADCGGPHRERIYVLF